MSRSAERKRREARVSELTIKYESTKDPTVLVMRGMKYLGLKRDIDALKDFNEAIRKDPNGKDAYYGRATALANLSGGTNKKLLIAARDTLARVMEKEEAGEFRLADALAA